MRFATKISLQDYRTRWGDTLIYDIRFSESLHEKSGMRCCIPYGPKRVLCYLRISSNKKILCYFWSSYAVIEATFEKNR